MICGTQSWAAETELVQMQLNMLNKNADTNTEKMVVKNNATTINMVPLAHLGFIFGDSISAFVNHVWALDSTLLPRPQSYAVIVPSCDMNYSMPWESAK